MVFYVLPPIDRQKKKNAFRAHPHALRHGVIFGHNPLDIGAIFGYTAAAPVAPEERSSGALYV